ncbi:MAG TPA: Stp1/IreP family PP2C-type Ser/Thr phosphatase [Rhodothermales bacterium]|nr:Stp1/IreP family PP2C-type Ser/Thr phosphatase [Rhodothermales bacterium]
MLDFMFGRKQGRALTIRVGASTDTGRVRSENQDSYGSFSPGEVLDSSDHLFIVADGMGGHARGQEASRMAVQVIRETYFGDRSDSVSQRLRFAFEAANREIHRLSGGDVRSETMGTTCTALAFCDGTLHLAHVGDSRAYRITRSEIRLLSEDHTVVASLLREGVLTQEEARTHPRRHALTRAIGVDASVSVDLVESEVSAGACYLLCSDGLADVAPEEIQKVVLSKPPQQACDALVQMANDLGGFDNTTVLIACVE